MSAAFPCPDRVALDRLARGVADPAEARALRDHLAACPQCRAVAWADSPTGGPGSTLSAPPPPDGPAPPTAEEVKAIGGYQVVRMIGQGGMGVVWEADDPGLCRRVAVKVMRPALAANPAGRERFLREARAAAAVSHDHVVPIFHVGEHDGLPFLVMPLLAGESLAERLGRAGPLTVGEVVRVGRELAAGLAAAHARGLVHRDVKPANIWLEDRGPRQPPRARLLDFGLARGGPADDTITGDGMVVGTPGYMSPEQALGLPVDGRTDLYSLGAVLYRTVTGARPGSASPERSRVPHPGLATLIDRLMANEPAGRPASAAEVERTLAQWTDAPGRPGRLGPWVISAGIGLVAVGVLIGIVSWPRDRPAPTGSAGTITSPRESPDRPAAEWARQAGGKVFVSADGGVQSVGPTEPLPSGPFRLRGVDLGGNKGVRGDDLRALTGVASLELLWLDESVLGNDDLVHLATLTGLRELDMGGTRITDEGLQHLRDLARLEVLTLTGTRVGDDGLPHLKSLRALAHLYLDGTRVTDAGMIDLTGFAHLAEVTARSTKVTSDGRARLRSVLRNCEVQIGPWVKVPRARKDRVPKVASLRVGAADPGNDKN